MGVYDEVMFISAITTLVGSIENTETFDSEKVELATYR